MADKKTKNFEKDGKNSVTPEKTGGIEDVIYDPKNMEKFVNIPKTLLKKEEWGMLTILNLMLAGIFPAYFVNILLISFFTEVGHLFTTHITVPKYRDNPKIAAIATQRADWIEKNRLNRGS